MQTDTLSLLIWTFRDEFLHKLRVGDAAIAISIKALSNHDQIKLARVDAVVGEDFS